MYVEFKFGSSTVLKLRNYIHYHFNTKASPLLPWNTKITSYFKKGDMENARKVFDEMPQKNVVTWNCMISGYAKNGMIRKAREAFDLMPIKNIVSWTAMLSAYAKNGRLEEARSLFDAIEDKNVVCWNSMVSGYISNGRLEEGMALFDVMPMKNDVSLAIMIEGYFQYGLLKEAKTLFEEAQSKTMLLCNAMLAGYSEMGCVEESYDLFMRMRERDSASWTSMITCLFRVGDMKGARKLFDEMPKKDVVSWTAMIQGYLNHNKIDLARELFDRMPDRDVITWNSMLVGYVENGKLCDEALLFYKQMLRNRYKPNHVTLNTVISVCGVHAKQLFGRGMHDYVIKSGYENDIMITSSLISMYSRCGFITEAHSVFERMTNRDTIAWNAMIVAQTHHNSAREVFDSFCSMIKAGSKPDHVTFLVLLTACAHSGLVREAFEYFSLMEQWNLVPKAEHYATIVDLLGRSGLLDEAFELVENLPVDLPAYAWEALLSACRVHGNFEFSNLIAERLARSRPCNVGLHVLRSNIYALHGMWKDAARVRAMLKQQQLKKESGCSWIEINGIVSCFSSNDESHTQSKDLYRELARLAALVEKVGA